MTLFLVSQDIKFSDFRLFVIKFYSVILSLEKIQQKLYEERSINAAYDLFRNSLMEFLILS
jgi:hypothetical protein